MLKNFLIWEGDMAAAGVTPCGIFTPTHLAATAVCLLALFLALYYSRNLDERRLDRIVRTVAFPIAALECAKIAFNLANGGFAPKHWLPLTFCSFSIFAYFMIGFGRGRVHDLGRAFMCGGGIVGGIAFLLYPMTSVAHYPMLHLLSCYSMLYHTVMMYVGLVYVQNGFYRYGKRGYLQFLQFTVPACLVALSVNIVYACFGAVEDCNMMFLSHPNLLPELFPFIGTAYAAAPWFYTLGALAVYLIIPYAVPFFVSRAVEHFRRPAEETLLTIEADELPAPEEEPSETVTETV